MKKSIAFIIITLILFSLMTLFISAITPENVDTFLRAGGGGSGNSKIFFLMYLQEGKTNGS